MYSSLGGTSSGVERQKIGHTPPDRWITILLGLSAKYCLDTEVVLYTKKRAAKKLCEAAKDLYSKDNTTQTTAQVYNMLNTLPLASRFPRRRARDLYVWRACLEVGFTDREKLLVVAQQDFGEEQIMVKPVNSNLWSQLLGSYARLASLIDLPNAFPSRTTEKRRGWNGCYGYGGSAEHYDYYPGQSRGRSQPPRGQRFSKLIPSDLMEELGGHEDCDDAWSEPETQGVQQWKWTRKARPKHHKKKGGPWYAKATNQPWECAWLGN